jgi:hypothetical protein
VILEGQSDVTDPQYLLSGRRAWPDAERHRRGHRVTDPRLSAKALGLPRRAQFSQNPLSTPGDPLGARTVGARTVAVRTVAVRTVAVRVATMDPAPDLLFYVNGRKVSARRAAPGASPLKPARLPGL